MKILSIALVLCLMVFFTVDTQAEPTTGATSKTDCPQSVVSAGHVVEGIFSGSHAGVWAYLCNIKQDDGKEFIVACDKDKDVKILGKEGTRVSVTYSVEQFWSEKSGECVKAETMTGGKQLAAKQQEESKPSGMKNLFKSSDKDSGYQIW